MKGHCVWIVCKLAYKLRHLSSTSGNEIRKIKITCRYALAPVWLGNFVPLPCRRVPNFLSKSLPKECPKECIGREQSCSLYGALKLYMLTMSG